MSDPTQVPAASPTGMAVLPQSLIKYAAPLVALAATIGWAPELLASYGLALPALPPVLMGIIATCKWITSLGAALGIVSQGKRVLTPETVAAGAAAAADPGKQLNG